MCTHSIDDLLPHAPLHCAATGEMVKGSYKIILLSYISPLGETIAKERSTTAAALSSMAAVSKQQDSQSSIYLRL